MVTPVELALLPERRREKDQADKKLRSKALMTFSKPNYAHWVTTWRAEMAARSIKRTWTTPT